MTSIPILAGCYASAIGDYKASYPVNLEPMLTATGFSAGYLKACAGITQIDLTPAEDEGPLPSGPDRGSIVFKGDQYRVIGDSLWKIDALTGVATLCGVVETNGLPVSMDFSFDLLAVASNRKLWYWDGSTVTQVTDPDLGIVLDMLWIDGYFLTTDGTSLVVTELSDPFSVNPLKYGSSEEDPDPIIAVRKVRGELYALNRNTVENFQNVGGNGFPFQRNSGALIEKGGVGTHATAYILETFVFLGGARNEAISVYLAGAGTVASISTSDVDKILAELSPADQALIQVESHVEQNEQRILIHLPGRETLVYSQQASLLNKGPVWHVLASGAGADEPYLGQHLCLTQGRWVVGDPGGRIGYLDPTLDTHYAALAGWRFDIVFLYNESKGGLIRTMELVGLPGHAPWGSDPTCFLSFTQDGRTYSVERAISQGVPGARTRRIQWRPKLRFANFMGARFRGANTALASWAHLEADIEPLAV
jgi:hypothetical protein